MDFEKLQILKGNLETIVSEWDETSRNQLIQYLESYLESGEFSKEFRKFFVKKFGDKISSERMRPEDKGKLTPVGVKKIVNELVEAIKKPSSKPEKKEK